MFRGKTLKGERSLRNGNSNGEIYVNKETLISVVFPFGVQGNL